MRPTLLRTSAKIRLLLLKFPVKQRKNPNQNIKKIGSESSVLYLTKFMLLLVCLLVRLFSSGI